MHSVLKIDEILYNIFGHYPGGKSNADFAALARTCRTFKDPALDLLWDHLEDMSPLARCLPDASCRMVDSFKREYYSFHRSLTQNEWGILRSYTRRIRSIFTCGLDEKSIECICDPPFPEPLFLNVRCLEVGYEHKVAGIFSVPFPFLTSLYVELYTLPSFEDSIKSLAKTSSSSLRRLEMINVQQIDPSFICQWRNLQSVRCIALALDANTLVHLSRMPALTELYFMVSSSLPDQIPLADSPLLIFPNLERIILNSKTLDPISRLLSRTRLPALKEFCALIDRCPSRLHLSSFVDIQMSALGRTIQYVSLCQQPCNPVGPRVPEDSPVLTFEYLQPWRAFTHLRDVHLELEWRVDLTNSELLTLASAWLHLKRLEIKGQWGWKTPNGITPDGLVQLLQTRPALTSLALAIDSTMRGGIPSSPHVGPKDRFCVDVLDACIDADAVPALTEFFAVVLQRDGILWSVWNHGLPVFRPHRSEDVRAVRWGEVCRRIKEIRGRRWPSSTPEEDYSCPCCR